MLPAVLIAASAASAHVALLDDPLFLKAIGEIVGIGVNCYAAPFYADMEGDEIPYLLVREFMDG